MRMIVAVAESAEAEQIARAPARPRRPPRQRPRCRQQCDGGGAGAAAFPSVSLPSVAAAAGGGEDPCSSRT